MAQLVNLKCPNCGAGLPRPGDHESIVTCEYCAASIAVSRDEHPPAAPPAGHHYVVHMGSAGPETPLVQEVRRELTEREAAAAKKGCLVVVVFLLLLVGGIVSLIVFLKGRDAQKRRDMVAKNRRQSKEREDKRLLDRYRDSIQSFIRDRENGAEDMEASVKKGLDSLLSQKEFPFPFHGKANAKYRVVFFVPYVGHYPDRLKAMERYRKKVMKAHPGLFSWFVIPLGKPRFIASIPQFAAFEIFKARGEKGWWDYYRLLSRKSDLGIPSAVSYMTRLGNHPRAQHYLKQVIEGLEGGFLRKIKRFNLDNKVFLANLKARKHEKLMTRIATLAEEMSISDSTYGGLVMKNYVWKIGHVYSRPERLLPFIYPELSKERSELVKRGLKVPPLP